VRLEILSAESLGVRGLCCRVEAGKRVIVIDPGVALGNWRYKLPPHPVQIAAGRAVRRRIVAALEGATDMVFSHFHGDHVPLFEPNPYQLGFMDLPPRIKTLRVWSLSPAGQSHTSQARARDLMDLLGPHFQVAEGLADGPLRFSHAVPHGIGGLPFGSVMLTRVDLGGRVFVHASDIQLLETATIDRILDWAPHWVLAAGPPLYLGRLDAEQRARARANARRLAAGVGTLILDHHLMRSLEGLDWLESLSSEVGRRIYCAADFMGRPRQLLEARRRELYAAMPVRAGWHVDYAHGLAKVEDFALFGA
jgi:predicted metallo-beta-lactamase superfamily hydrolase